MPKQQIGGQHWEVDRRQLFRGAPEWLRHVEWKSKLPYMQEVEGSQNEVEIL